jgi:hypothetical protein
MEGRNDYAKDMYITVEISLTWEGISNNWEMGSVLPNKVSSEPR